MTRARETAIGVIHRLRDAGHVAWLAGGCVRDELLGRRPTDYDVATDARPERVRSLFRRTNEVGAAFGVVLVRESGVTIEVTTFRREGAYSDTRRPDEIEYADAESDARRRDFTINALFLDPLAEPGPFEQERSVAGRVIDYVGGVDDLDRRLIRAVGDPEARLAEDHLRALRAARFAARLGFAIDDGAADAIRRHAQSLTGVSRERIGDEIRRMLTDPTRAAAAHLIEALGLDAPALTEPAMGPRTAHDPLLLASLPAESDYPLALAAWSLERTVRSLRPAVADPAHPDIAEALARIPARWRRALCLANDAHGALARTLHILIAQAQEWPRLGVAGRKKLAADPRFEGALRLFEACQPDRARALADDVERLRGDGVGLAPDPYLSGDALIALGFVPGPALGAALGDLYDRQLAGDLVSVDDARRAAEQLLQGR